MSEDIFDLVESFAKEKHLKILPSDEEEEDFNSSFTTSSTTLLPTPSVASTEHQSSTYSERADHVLSKLGTRGTGLPPSRKSSLYYEDAQPYNSSSIAASSSSKKSLPNEPPPTYPEATLGIGGGKLLISTVNEEEQSPQNKRNAITGIPKMSIKRWLSGKKRDEQELKMYLNPDEEDRKRSSEARFMNLFRRSSRPDSDVESDIPNKPAFASDIPSNGKEKMYFIRIYRRDGTFGTISCGLSTSAAELCHMLARKFLMNDISKHILYLYKNGIERVLGPMEKPLFLQKKWLVQLGYLEEDDDLAEVGREDNSYVFQFIFGEIRPPPAIKLPKEIDTYGQLQCFELQAMSLPSVPKVLYRYAQTIHTLNLSQNHLIDISGDFISQCRNLRELMLSNNNYNVIPTSIRQCQVLQTLDLSCNRLRELEHGQLHLLHSLLILKLQNNRLLSIPSSFAQLRSLTMLYLSNNRLESFPRVLCELSFLQELDLSFNRLKQLPDEIGNLENLGRLLLVGNRLSGTFPRTFDSLVSLRELDLRQNNIQDLGVLGNMSNLVYLYIDYNSVSTLSCQFKSLQQLTLTKNHLTMFIADSTTPTASLHYLNLSKCKLPQLPDDLFKNFPELEKLVLDNNQLVAIPSSLSTLTHLMELSLTDNAIANLPAGFDNLVYLTRLDLHNNNLKTLPTEIWLLPSLVSLNASSCLLASLPEPPANIPPRLLPNTKKGTATPAAITSRTTPPLAATLRYLYLGDNSLTNDVFSILAYFTDLETLNLSFNDIYEIPKNGFFNLSKLKYLHLSGNKITALPAEEIGRLRNLKELFLNGNRLQSLPGELGKTVGLRVLDVGCNNLKYNISNWPYDWNWNWNLELKHLNLSGNKRFEIKSHSKQITDFSSLSNLRILGLMDITLMLSVPDESSSKRVRLTPTEINHMRYGVSDTLGKSEHLILRDLAVPRFRGLENETLFGLFDGRPSSLVGLQAGSKVAKFLNDNFALALNAELTRHKTVNKALRRCFFNINKDLSTICLEHYNAAASAVVIYQKDKTLFATNVGDALAVMSRGGGAAQLISKRHSPWEPAEIARIQAAGGYVSHQGRLNDQLEVSRVFGRHDLLPIVNACPHIQEIDLTDNDEFVILASRELWDYISPQTAVDIVRKERDDPMVAAQKLRDVALSYGAYGAGLMVMFINLADLFDPKRKKGWILPPHVQAAGRNGMSEDMWQELKKNNRREKEAADSTLARLAKEVPAPMGQVALVFTDIKNSTHLWETFPKGMQSAIKTHNKILRRYLRNIGGYEVKTEGDAFMVCFPAVSSALLWCLTCQLQLMEVDWPQEILDSPDGVPVYFPEEEGEMLFRGLSVRMGIHWGSPVCEEDPVTHRMDYFGPMVNKSARISGIADGGQITVSSDVIKEVSELQALLEVAEDDLEPYHRKTCKEIKACRSLGYIFYSLGERKLKGMENPEHISVVYPQTLARRFDYVRMKETKTLEIELTRMLGLITLRLERLSGGIFSDTLTSPSGPPSGRSRKRSSVSTRRSKNDILANLLKHQIKDDANEAEMCRILENFIIRIENVIAAITLHKYMVKLPHLCERLNLAPEQLWEMLN